MEPPEVVNKRREPFDVYIGRPSVWGNPFVIGTHGDRAEVIDLYRDHLIGLLESGEVSEAELRSLSGQRLGCFCKPKACHGDVIVEVFAEHFGGE